MRADKDHGAGGDHGAPPIGQASRWTVRVIVGWSAVTLNLLVSCFWAFWGAIELGRGLRNREAYPRR
jgi:hypothetical protein